MNMRTLAASYLLALAHGLVSPLGRHDGARSASGRSSIVQPISPVIMMASDFASAMPEKPEVSLEERLLTSAENFVSNMRGNLGEGVEEPPELIALENACKAKEPPTALTRKTYELMIEVGMCYDKDPDTNVLTPTSFDDIAGSLDIPEVKQEFSYLYSYGMNLIANGLIDTDSVKEIVEERLIKRTGLSPEEFDKWLGY